MYNKKYYKIVNPETGRKVNINSKLGKKILNNYLIYKNGGKPCSSSYYKTNVAMKTPVKRSEYVQKSQACFKRNCNANTLYREYGNCPNDDPVRSLKQVHEDEFLCEDTDSYFDCSQKTINAGKCYNDRLNRFTLGLQHKCFETLDESHAWNLGHLNDIMNTNVEHLASQNGKLYPYHLGVGPSSSESHFTFTATRPRIRTTPPSENDNVSEVTTPSVTDNVSVVDNYLSWADMVNNDESTEVNTLSNPSGLSATAPEFRPGTYSFNQ